MQAKSETVDDCSFGLTVSTTEKDTSDRFADSIPCALPKFDVHVHLRVQWDPLKSLCMGYHEGDQAAVLMVGKPRGMLHACM